MTREPDPPPVAAPAASADPPATADAGPRLRWNPMPTAPPRVDPEFPALHGVPRSAEALRYAALRLEHFVSPEGTLREWYRFIAYGSLALLVPCLLLIPPLTWIFAGFTTLSEYLALTALNLALAATGATVVLLLLRLVMKLFSGLLSRRVQRHYHYRRYTP